MQGFFSIMRCTFWVMTASAILGCHQDADPKTEPTIPGGPGHAVIEVISIPAYDDAAGVLFGRTRHVDPAAFQIAVYAYHGGWWNKPDPPKAPGTGMASDGMWSCDVTTLSGDERATRFAVFLLPRTTVLPVVAGTALLDSSLYSISRASFEITRTVSTAFRTIHFSGRDWNVKSSPGPVGPGPNVFSDSGENVWLDSSGALHLKIMQQDQTWTCAEVVSQTSFGYGTYTFTLGSPVHDLNERVVLGLFTWDDQPDEHHREIDIEFSRWNVAGNDNSQFVVQPWDWPGRTHRFHTVNTSPSHWHRFAWSSGSILFQSQKSSSAVEAWNYTGTIPAPGQENARMNLWLVDGLPPSDGLDSEIIVQRFDFSP